MSFQIGSLIPQFAAIQGILEDNTLARAFKDALYPELLYRMEAEPDRWEANLGTTETETRSGEHDVDTDPITPGQDPLPENESFEQWTVTAAQHTKTTDINMATARSSIPGLYLRKVKNLGLNAGKTMNRLARNNLMLGYATGHTVADTGGAPTTAPRVASIAGFTHQLLGNQIQPVSASNPKSFYLNGVLVTTTQVIAATPDSAANPYGPGTLTLSGAGTTIAADDAIVAADAASIIRSGGGTSVDALASTDILTVADVRQAVAILRRNNVPTHPDGFYHCHLDPLAESQLFSDNEFQRLNESNYGSAPYQMFAVGKLLGCIFYTNSESPSSINSGTLIQSRPSGAAAAMMARDIGAEVINEGGVQILRTVITGGGAVYEKYIDESEYLSEAGSQGKIGGFNVVNNGVAVATERIRLVLRAPQDRLGQIVAATWSWSGDFGVPSDYLGGATGSRFKRAVVIESGQNV